MQLRPLYLTLALLLTGTAGMAQFVTPANTGQATVVIAPNYTFTQSNALSFGSVLPNLVGTGTVAVSTASAVTPTGVASVSGTPAAAAWAWSGPSLPTANTPASTSVTLAGQPPMAVDTFTTLVTQTSGVGITPVTATVNVGATLHVGANQPAGTYNGTYALTLNYN